MKTIFFILLLFSFNLQASVEQKTAQGFHWYSSEDEEVQIIPDSPIQQPSSNTISPYEELLESRKMTLNKLAESLLRPSMESTKNYMIAQQETTKRHQEFVQNWERVLLAHPELDHRLNFPTDNNALAIKNDEKKALTQAIIEESAKQYGFIFIYQGESALAQRFASMIDPFMRENNFSVIAITVDESVLPQFDHSKNLPLEVIRQRFPVELNYLPALFLVNLKTEEMFPLSYGFMALSDLKMRLLDVVTDFKRFSYEGLE